jgi:hypothetical protein
MEFTELMGILRRHLCRHTALQKAQIGRVGRDIVALFKARGRGAAQKLPDARSVPFYVFGFGRVARTLNRHIYPLRWPHCSSTLCE